MISAYLIADGTKRAFPVLEVDMSEIATERAEPQKLEGVADLWRKVLLGDEREGAAERGETEHIEHPEVAAPQKDGESSER